jgi:hypothetical protein
MPATSRLPELFFGRRQFRQLHGWLCDCLLVAPLNFVVNLLTVDRNCRRGFDANFDRLALDAHHFHADVPGDYDAFACFS